MNQVFKGDIHIHIDYEPERQYWHGERPKNIAGAIAASDLDFYAITEHNRVTPRFFEVQEELHEICKPTRNFIALLGVEMTVMFNNRRYHVGYIFEEQFHPQNLPEILPLRSDLYGLEEYRSDYPGVAILNHPALRDRQIANHLDTTADMLDTGLIDGIEVLNGSLILNGPPAVGGNFRSNISRDGFNLLANARKKRPRLAAIGASDAHRANLVGKGATTFRGSSPRDFFHAVKQGSTTAVLEAQFSIARELQVFIAMNSETQKSIVVESF